LYNEIQQGGSKVSGMHRLAQKFLLELLTVRGSAIYRPRRGCDFLVELHTGGNISPVQVYGAYSRALLSVTANLQSAEYETDPPDEQFHSAELDLVEIMGDTVSIRITLTSMARTQQTFAVAI